MDRSWIYDVSIEPRGEDGGKNITLVIEPPARATYKLPTYAELTLLAESVFRDAMKADSKKFVPTHADVMAWSKGPKVTSVPHRYRVTMDLVPPGVADAAEELE